MVVLFGIQFCFTDIVFNVSWQCAPSFPLCLANKAIKVECGIKTEDN